MHSAAFESITWLPVCDHQPDADITVLVAQAGQPERTWLAWISDDDQWLDVSSGGPLGFEVTHWADVPAGPAMQHNPAPPALQPAALAHLERSHAP